MTVKPTLEEVKRLYMDYKAVPLSTEIPMSCTAIEVLKKLKKVSSHCYMLESAEDTKETGRYTFLGFDPRQKSAVPIINCQLLMNTVLHILMTIQENILKNCLMSTKVQGSLICRPLQADLWVISAMIM